MLKNIFKKKLYIISPIALMMAMSNKSYADIIAVPDGVLNIKQEGIITYKHSGIEETEIKDYNGQPVKIPQEILYHIPNSKGGEKSLRFGYIVKDQEIDQRSLVDIKRGVLFTGMNVKIKINEEIAKELREETCKKTDEIKEEMYDMEKKNEGNHDYVVRMQKFYQEQIDSEWKNFKNLEAKILENNKLVIKPIEENSVFAAIGINLTEYHIFIRDSGITDIDANYILFIGNKICYKESYFSIYLFANHRGETNIGSANTKILLVSDTILINDHAKFDASIEDKEEFVNYERLNFCNFVFFNRAITKLDGEFIAIKNSNSGVFDNNEGTIVIGSEITKVISITNNKGKYISSIIINNSNSNIVFNGNLMSIVNNIISARYILKDAGGLDRYELLLSLFNSGDNDKKEEYIGHISIKNWGTININLFGNSPCFTLAGNTVQKYNGDKKEGYSDKDIIGIAMLTQGLFFERNLPPKLVITNNADTIATVIFGHDVRSFYDGDCIYMNHADINSILIIRGNGKNNDTNNPIKIEEKSKPSKNSVGIGNEEDIGLTSFIPIGSGVGSAFLVSSSVHINDNNNYNDNFTFSHTNDNNNNNNEKDEESNKPKDSYIKTILGNNMLEFNRVFVERGDVVIFITLNGKGLVGTGKDSELNIDESSRIFIEIEGSAIKSNSKRIVTISKFKNIADEVKKRIFLGPISKGKGFLGSFVGNDFIISTAMPTIEINNNNDDDDDYNKEEKDSKEKTDDNCLIQ